MGENSPTTPAAPVEPGGGGGIAELAAQHAQQFPQPNKESVAAEEQKLATDLDPELYVINPDGTAARNKDGTLKKKTGPKKKVEGTAEAFGEFGMVAAESTFMAFSALLGPAWQPTDEEKRNLTNAWGTYLKAKGINDVPPGVLLLATLVAYARPRITDETTQGRIVGVYQWLKSKFKRKAQHSTSPQPAADSPPN